MQKLLLKREIRSNKAMLGILYIEGKEVAKTLENPYLENKTNVSCIPEGVYKGKKDDVGRFRWWKLDVPSRPYIEIHQGNRERDTRGCIIIGEKWGFLHGELAVLNSVKTLEKLKDLIEDEFELTIIR